MHADSMELEPQPFTALVGGVEGKVWNEKHISPQRVGALTSALTASVLMTYTTVMASAQPVSRLGRDGRLGVTCGYTDALIRKQDISAIAALYGASFEVAVLSGLAATLAGLGTSRYEWYRRQIVHGSRDDIGTVMLLGLVRYEQHLWLTILSNWTGSNIMMTLGRERVSEHQLRAVEAQEWQRFEKVDLHNWMESERWRWAVLLWERQRARRRDIEEYWTKHHRRTMQVPYAA